MKVAIGADHAGFALKEDIGRNLKQRGVVVKDVGTHGPEPVDYPDYAAAVAKHIQQGHVERGILICGSGVGASIAANKFAGVRAGLCHDGYSAHQGVEHDDMNILVLGARVIGPALAGEIVDLFLSARFSNADRHRRRLAKIAAFERNGG
jgi:RpiB/LacA/LacB family sugar-phosphate isomerase